MTFLERYRQTETQVQAYVGGLPLWVNVWRGWMFLVFGAVVVFVLWTPLAAYLARRRPRLPVAGRFDSLYARWLGVALATMVVSIAFDVYNVAYSLVRGVP
jgi:hypothetical protein